MKQLRLLLEGIFIAGKALRAHLLRTFLTMLGVSFGILTITAIFTLVDSLTFSITENLSKLGNSVMFVHHWPWDNNFDEFYKYRNRPKVSYDDFLTLKRELNNVSGVAFNVEAHGQDVEKDGSSVTGISVRGITYDFGEINAFDIIEGRYFSEMECEAGRPVCILGWNVAVNLLGPHGPYAGQEVRFGGKKLVVAGVLKGTGSSFFGQSPDDVLYIPYMFAARRFNTNARVVDKLITIRAENQEMVDRVESETIGLVRQARGLKPGVDDNFSINKYEMLMNQIGNAMKYLETGGIFIAILSVIVGGFGIGNIMFASVKERTFEIGLQKALGATRSFILFQFLFESVMMCLIGGFLGLGMLYLGTIAGEYFIAELGIQMNLVITPRNVSWGMGIALLIGVFSGILPSIYASGLQPVESMRAK